MPPITSTKGLSIFFYLKVKTTTL